MRIKKTTKRGLKDDQKKETRQGRISGRVFLYIHTYIFIYCKQTDQRSCRHLESLDHLYQLHPLDLPRSIQIDITVTSFRNSKAVFE